MTSVWFCITTVWFPMRTVCFYYTICLILYDSLPILCNEHLVLYHSLLCVQEEPNNCMFHANLSIMIIMQIWFDRICLLFSQGSWNPSARWRRPLREAARGNPAPVSAACVLSISADSPQVTRPRHSAAASTQSLHCSPSTARHIQEVFYALTVECAHMYTSHHWVFHSLSRVLKILCPNWTTERLTQSIQLFHIESC